MRVTRLPRRTTPAKIGLALAGGGFLGAAYELGALAALAEAIDGLELNKLDTYVGVSVGSFVAAGLASGVSPYQMVRMFADHQDSELSFDPVTLVQPAYKELFVALKSLPRVGAIALRAAMREAPSGVRTMLWRMIEQTGPALPIGLLSGLPAQQKLAELLSRDSRGDDFRRLRATLRVVATDIDSGLPVEFGSPGYDHVPISQAVAASSAIPGIFAPVEIDQRHYVDGALNKTLHASVALNAGAQLVFCVNPLVPFASASAASSEVSREPHANLFSLLTQSVRTAIRSRMGVGLEKYRSTHPDADVLLFEPRANDARMFHASIFSVNKRRQLCEHAYLQTRRDLLARADLLAPILARHGLRLNLSVLRDDGLTLLREQARPKLAQSSQLHSTLARLHDTLDDLDRTLHLSKLSATRS